MIWRMGRMALAAALMVAPAAAMAQASGNPNTTVKTSRSRSAAARHSGGVTGQQHSQPSANQNQPQMQTDNSQQPPNVTVLPPTARSQNQPNPLPQLAK